MQYTKHEIKELERELLLLDKLLTTGEGYSFRLYDERGLEWQRQ